MSPSLRKQLERTVVDAREVAETGARAALEALAVHQHKPYKPMAPKQRGLRRRLRAHGRQLGDRRDGRGTQTIDRLAHECAYEHWHRMLFARFLAENQLLIEPDSGVAISLDECEELARERAQDRWTLAGRFAERMLPRIFRPDAPALEVRLAPEIRQALERLVDSLPVEVFAATDSLGWVYQFWQSEKKKEVNRSEVKIGTDELPAVTQLFTEPYMVSFLLDNGLGAWWAARRLNDADLEKAGSEAELRRKAAVPGAPLDYLRLARHEDTTGTTRWRLAPGNFDGWPEHLGELKILDPCCGSGHFMVVAFSMLVPMRMAREHLTAPTAVDAVLRENLHGLELDPRCVELAAFALALAAWTYPGAGGYRPLPELNLACSGLTPNATKEQWLALAEPAAAAGGMPTERNLFAVRDSLLSAPLRNSLAALYDLFSQAPELGSLIGPHALKANLFQGDFELVRGLLAATLEQERTTEEQAERAVAAQGMARAAELLAGRYHWVITNVPYLTRGKQDEKLRTFCAQHYPASKNDLATVFLERCLELCTEGGTASLVLPQNWLFLTSYRKLREKLLKTEIWHLLARLGPGAFETISGEVVKVILLTLIRGHPAGHPIGLSDETKASGIMYGLDVSESRTAGEKAARLRVAEIQRVEQARQLNNPDARMALEEIPTEARLDNYCASIEGLTTGDMERFVSKFWEGALSRGWDPYIQNVDYNTHFGGRTDRILWEKGDGVLSRFPTAHNFPGEIMNGKRILGKSGLRVTQMRKLPVTIYTGEVFGKSGATVVPDDLKHLPAIYCFCSSPDYNQLVRQIDQKLNVTNATLVKVPFDLDRWTRIARERYPNGLPCPYSDDPTQWIFHGHPCGSVVWDETEKRTEQGPIRTDSTVLQIAVARLLGGCPRTRKIIVFENLTLYKSIVYKQDFFKIVYSRTAS